MTQGDGDTLGDLLLRAAREVRGTWMAALRERGIAPHHARALRMLGDGPCRPGQLAERLRVTPRAATDVVEALVERGLVDREPDPHDRRAVVVALTDDGRRLGEEAHRLRREAADALFAPLSPDERADLARLLRLVVGSGRPT